MLICVDLIFSIQLKAKCNRSLSGNPRTSVGMKENECQGCLFPSSWKVCPCGVEAPPNPCKQTERRMAELSLVKTESLLSPKYLNGVWSGESEVDHALIYDFIFVSQSSI